jgi:adenine phosphoribosyltransferase
METALFTPLQTRLDDAIRVVDDFPKPGISFKDITPVLLDRELVHDCVQAIAQEFSGRGVTKVIGIESRGFLLGPMVAQALNAGFVIVRKKGKLPAQTVEMTYDLEYGSATIEMHTDALRNGDNVLIHDDLLATGGTAAAAARLAMLQHGVQLAGFTFLVELGFLGGRPALERLAPHVHSLVAY